MSAMQRNGILAGVTAALLIVGILGCLHTGGKGQWVVIRQNNKEVQRVALSQITEPCTICVTGENGEENRICITSGGVYMEYANCPDGLCMDTGIITRSDTPIVCLPNGVVVQILTEETP